MDLQPSDRFVFAAIYYFERMKDGKCIASNPTIARIAKVDSHSVQNSLTRLEEKGFIKRLYKDAAKRMRTEIKCLVGLKVSSYKEPLSLFGDTEVSLSKDDINKNNINKRDIGGEPPLTNKKSKPEKIHSDTYHATQKSIEKSISAYQTKPKYQRLPTDPFDWRYLIDGGKGLNPSKLFVAIYWQQKEELSDKKFSYSFKRKEQAEAALVSELKFASQLAEALTVNEFKKKLEQVDELAFDEKSYEYSYEWKLSTILKNLHNND